MAYATGRRSESALTARPHRETALTVFEVRSETEVMIPTTSVHVLDRAIASSLDGHHLRFARRHGRAVRYQTDVAVFAALDDPNDSRAWDDAVHLLEPDVPFVVFGVTQWPDGWEPIRMLEGVQMEGSGVVPEPDPEAVVLGPDDVPEILDLIARTDPGPYRQRTIELGTYLGI